MMLTCGSRGLARGACPEPRHAEPLGARPHLCRGLLALSVRPAPTARPRGGFAGRRLCLRPEVASAGCNRGGRGCGHTPGSLLRLGRRCPGQFAENTVSPRAGRGPALLSSARLWPVCAAPYLPCGHSPDSTLTPRAGSALRASGPRPVSLPLPGLPSGSLGPGPPRAASPDPPGGARRLLTLLLRGLSTHHDP